VLGRDAEQDAARADRAHAPVPAAQQTYDEQTISLQTGDCLLLYTDGVTDTPGAQERFGTDRLRDTLAAAPDDPQPLLETIERALKDFQAGTAIDDRALLALRRG
jgi:serine phosphatase RsbU (regulator of sigma subunit)